MREQKLPLRLLKTDYTYQSPVKDSQVVKIVRDFDPKALHTIVVSEREDGTYYIIDGQHRVVALIRLNYDFIRCTVHTGLTREEEAKMYHDLNNRPNKTRGSKGKAKFAYNEESAVKLDELVKSTGMQINYEHTGHRKGYISPYATLEQIYKKHGDVHLNNVIVVIKSAFGNDGKHFQSDIMYGFSKFLKTYYKTLDMQNLVDKLENVGFEGLMDKVENEKFKFKNKKECLPYVMTDIYNRNKKKGQLDRKQLMI